VQQSLRMGHDSFTCMGHDSFTWMGHDSFTWMGHDSMRIGFLRLGIGVGHNGLD